MRGKPRTAIAEADAVAIRLRATRRLDQMRQAQKESVGLNRGTLRRGLSNNPRDERPTLASHGIDKNLAQQARVLGALSEEKFEALVVETHDKVARAVRNAVREVEILQERESYAARIDQGGTIEDLRVLAASGYRASVIYADVPSRYTTYSGKGKQRSADRYYNTMTVDEIKVMGPVIRSLAAKDCALLYWTSGPQNANALDVIRAWGFDYKTWAFVWLKTNASAGIVEVEDLTPKHLHWGTGFTTRANAEVVLLGTRGAPMRLSEDVHQIIIAPAIAHSEKPEEVARRIERLYPCPYLELFARKPRPAWTTWGNEIPPPAASQTCEMPDIPDFLRRRPEATPRESWSEMWAKPFDFSRLKSGGAS
jgi:N6-adenosine-specific RNA methylase IME4